MKPTSLLLLLAFCLQINAQGSADDWTLIFHDEFDGTEVNWDVWQSEHGLVRNEEYQWYQPQNAHVQDGVLLLEGRIDSIPNPNYNPEGRDWRQRRPYAPYSSASINTRHSFQFQYGRLEVRARIPAVIGSWPGIWTLGSSLPWPSCGEIDVMEYYHIQGKPHILANAAWGGERRGSAVWNTKRIPYDHFLELDPYWGERFHTWLMDWSEDSLLIYLDGELLNEVDLTQTINGAPGQNKNPMRQPHYILLNLAIGGLNGGEPVADAFPMRYEIDYVRVWQKQPKGN